MRNGVELTSRNAKRKKEPKYEVACFIGTKTNEV
jgi:hypothetical protein